MAKSNAALFDRGQRDMRRLIGSGGYGGAQGDLRLRQRQRADDSGYDLDNDPEADADDDDEETVCTFSKAHSARRDEDGQLIVYRGGSK